MNLYFKPFNDFVSNYTTEMSRRRYNDSIVKTINVEENYITAKVQGSKLYDVDIYYTSSKVSSAHCTCEYDYGGFCKHIIHVLVVADEDIRSREIYSSNPFTDQASTYTTDFSSDEMTLTDEGFLFEGKHILNIEQEKIDYLTRPIASHDRRKNVILNSADIMPDKLRCLTIEYFGRSQFLSTISQTAEGALLSCNCANETTLLCAHLQLICKELLRNDILQLAFYPHKRQKALANQASKLGWGVQKSLDNYFDIQFTQSRLFIHPKINMMSFDRLVREGLQPPAPNLKLPDEKEDNMVKFVILRQCEYQDCIEFHLMQAPVSRNKTIKQPLINIAPYEDIKEADTAERKLFYTAIALSNENQPEADDLLNLLRNPDKLEFYHYDGSINRHIPVKALTPIFPQTTQPTVSIEVSRVDEFYEIKCFITVEQQKVNAFQARAFDNLLLMGDKAYGLSGPLEKKVLQFFQKQNLSVMLLPQDFEKFQKEFLEPAESTMKISYNYIKTLPSKLNQQMSITSPSTCTIYLSEMDDFILITPAVTYGDVEVSLLSRKTPYVTGTDGIIYAVERDADAEHRLLRTIQAQHNDFDKVPQTDFYYLHRKHFFDSGWFAEALEAWREEGHRIYGFNRIKNNRYSAYPIHVRTSVQSGIDWFDIHAEVSYGKQKVSLKKLQRSIVNKSRFVELDDGTHGILPQKWIDKFGGYFRVGEIVEDRIKAHKGNFHIIDQLFEDEVLSSEVQHELQTYSQKLANFNSIDKIEKPEKLAAQLRDYQKEGLNWLNFLDEFNFGGCLADDMGLGKTIQIIAYFLLQHEKGNHRPNLVVLPTSLLFNWQREIDKFAPHLRYVTLHGSKRDFEKIDMDAVDVVFTTYGTLLHDIHHLKNTVFNVIVLDESQAIKNPDSKRYKAVRLLQGRQRLVLTGTPIENNTFDLFAQMSFVLPGILGNAKHFADSYSTPIDKFGDTKRAVELQSKMHPFILRRTKKQVATELPDKIEMVISCEMGDEQRRVYDAYKKEFQHYLKGMDEADLPRSSLHILQGMTKLRQICNSPGLLSDNEFYGDQSAKIEELMTQISKLKDNHKILVFSQFVGMLELIRSQLDKQQIRYAYLTGKTKNREEQVADFQENTDTRVFLISLKAGGVGLNLTEAEYVFLVDPWWNPAAENQAIDRAHRIGQTNKVVAVRLITPDSIEEKIMKLQERKLQLANDLIPTETGILKQLTKNDLMNLL